MYVTSEHTAHLPSPRISPIGTRTAPCAPLRADPRDPWRHVSPAHPILNSSFLILNWSYTFSAKEKDTETGYSYFGSRYYSSDLSIWLSVDPMASKYPHQSNYAYCSNNPIKVVDPDGEDEWEVNQSGYIRQGTSNYFFLINSFL